MEQKKFIQVLKKIVKETVRDVIKEELTEILHEGLQSTINEIKGKQSAAPKPRPVVKPNKVHNKFKENKFSDILNGTGALREQTNYADIMNEDIHMTSANAKNFGMQRNMMNASTSTVSDPETGQAIAVEDPAIAKAMNRDYSALMKAIDKKKNR